MTTLGMLQCSVAGVGFPRELSTIKSLIAKPLQSSVSQNYPSQWTDLDGVKRLAKNHSRSFFLSRLLGRNLRFRWFRLHPLLCLLFFIGFLLVSLIFLRRFVWLFRLARSTLVRLVRFHLFCLCWGHLRIRRQSFDVPKLRCEPTVSGPLKLNKLNIASYVLDIGQSPS